MLPRRKCLLLTSNYQISKVLVVSASAVYVRFIVVLLWARRRRRRLRNQLAYLQGPAVPQLSLPVVNGLYSAALSTQCNNTV